jgi:hypothetical protein
MKNKHVMYLDNYKHLSCQVAKKIVQKFIHMKKKLQEKKHVIYFYNNHVSSLYPICTLLL